MTKRQITHEYYKLLSNQRRPEAIEFARYNYWAFRDEIEIEEVDSGFASAIYSLTSRNIQPMESHAFWIGVRLYKHYRTLRRKYPKASAEQILLLQKFEN